MNFIQVLTHTSTTKANSIIRLMVGSVFLSEGIQKFIFPAIRGVGRFEKIGIPYPELTGPLIGSIEVVCGMLLILGLFTRIASFLTMAIMLVALYTTKYNLIQSKGIWPMLHSSRTDWSMLLGSLFLLIKGAGGWSLDLKLYNSFTNKS